MYLARELAIVRQQWGKQNDCNPNSNKKINDDKDDDESVCSCRCVVTTLCFGRVSLVAFVDMATVAPFCRRKIIIKRNE